MRTPAALLLVLFTALPALARADLPTDELEDRTRTEMVPKPTPETDQTVKLVAELGTALARGNTETLHLGGNARLVIAPGKSWVFETYGSALYEQSRGATIANAWELSQRVDRFLTSKLSLFAAAGIQRDLFAGLDRRLSGQLGAALLAWETRDPSDDDLVTNRLRLELGFYGAREDFKLAPNAAPDAVLEEDHRKIYASRAAASYLHALSRTASAGLDVEVIQDFVDTRNVVTNSSVYVAAALAEGFALKVTGSHRFDNVPAEPTLKKSDFLLTAGLVVSL